jgi:hypothetical protein
MTFSHPSTDNVSRPKSLAESQLGRASGSRRTWSPWPSLYPGSSLANAKFGSRLVSENSLFSGSPPSRLTVTTPSICSVMSEESFSNAKSGGQLVSLNPLLPSVCSPSCQTVALGEGRPERMASPLPPKTLERPVIAG